MSESLELQKVKAKYTQFVTRLSDAEYYSPSNGINRPTIRVPASEILDCFLEANPDFAEFRKELAEMYSSEQNLLEDEWKNPCPDH